MHNKKWLKIRLIKIKFRSHFNNNTLKIKGLGFRKATLLKVINRAIINLDSWMIIKNINKTI